MNALITFLPSFLFIAVAEAAMAVGVIEGRVPIKGSCGGVGSGGCELCSGNCRRKAADDA